MKIPCAISPKSSSHIVAEVFLNVQESLSVTPATHIDHSPQFFYDSKRIFISARGPSGDVVEGLP
jgi:hypothetical protein